jgi:hypothetical protein
VGIKTLGESGDTKTIVKKFYSVAIATSSLLEPLTEARPTCKDAFVPVSALTVVGTVVAVGNDYLPTADEWTTIGGIPVLEKQE